MFEAEFLMCLELKRKQASAVCSNSLELKKELFLEEETVLYTVGWK